MGQNMDLAMAMQREHWWDARLRQIVREELEQRAPAVWSVVTPKAVADAERRVIEAAEAAADDPASAAMFDMLIARVSALRAARLCADGTAQRPAGVVVTAGDELGWVIERYINGELNYWNGRKADRSGWTNKNSEAVRFAREQDGWPVLSWLLQGDGRVTEHAWVAPPVPVSGAKDGAA